MSSIVCDRIWIRISYGQTGNQGRHNGVMKRAVPKCWWFMDRVEALHASHACSDLWVQVKMCPVWHKEVSLALHSPKCPPGGDSSGCIEVYERTTLQNLIASKHWSTNRWLHYLYTVYLRVKNGDYANANWQRYSTFPDVFIAYLHSQCKVRNEDQECGSPWLMKLSLPRTNICAAHSVQAGPIIPHQEHISLCSRLCARERGPFPKKYLTQSWKLGVNKPAICLLGSLASTWVCLLRASFGIWTWSKTRSEHIRAATA